MKNTIITILTGALFCSIAGCQSTALKQNGVFSEPTGSSLPEDAVATFSKPAANEYNPYAQLGIYNIPNRYNLTAIVQKGVKITTWLEYEDKDGKTKKVATIIKVLRPEDGSFGKSILFTFICAPGTDYYTFYTMADVFSKPDLGGINAGSSTKIELKTSFLLQKNKYQQQKFERNVELPLKLDKTIELGKYSFDKMNIVKAPSLGPMSSTAVSDKSFHREVRQYCKFTVLSSKERDQINRAISRKNREVSK